MAELPDLSVFANTLSKKFGSKTLEKLYINVAKKLNVTAAELQNKLEDQKLIKVERVGKTLQFHFGKEILGLHLMLKGELLEMEKDEPAPRHTILAFYFKGDTGFAVTDTLKQATPTLNPPGNKTPDALDIDEQDFLALLSRRRKKIKEVLMDQKAIRGIGNSYADEILWGAISPFSTANAIPEKSAKVLYKEMRQTLNFAIKAIEKENQDELRGELRDFMQIHGFGIGKSPTGHPIRSEKINGRTAYFTDEQKRYQ